MQSEIVSNKYKNPDTIFLFKYIIKGSTMCVFIILSFFLPRTHETFMSHDGFIITPQLQWRG